MARIPAEAVLHTLHNANGSATCTSPNKTCKLICGVNYPVELPRRSDELPESTLIEVNLRPHNGVGMVKERHIESLIQRTLQTIVLTDQTPRTMLQVTIQVVSVESDESLPGGVKEGGQGETYLDVLIGAVNAAVLGCMDAGVQMREVVGAALVGVGRDGGLIANPSVTQRWNCSSIHGFAITRTGKLVLMESEGTFEMAEWEAAESLAQQLVLGSGGVSAGDVDMNGDASSTSCLMNVLRQAVETKVARNERWKQE